MQGNKKHADGQSDSSSLGSLLDDTDREVCSLTDRAFKSLCVAELEASYTDSDPIISPTITHKFSTKFFQVPQNCGFKKSTLSNKLLSKSMEHSTFQQLPKDTQEEKKAVINITPNIRRKLGLPVPSLRNYKHTSKVSSLIKTFDKAESQETPAIAKQPLKNSFPKGQLIGGGNIAPWGSGTILNIQKELSKSTIGGQDITNASSGHEMHKRHSQMDLACPDLPSFYSSQANSLNMPKSNTLKKMGKTRMEKSKEPTRKGNFLHSENSAFESWNAHHKKLIEIGGSSEIIPKEDNLTSFEETRYVKESCMPEHKLSPIQGPIILELDVSSEKTLSQTSLSPISLSQRPFPPLSTNKDTVSETLLTPVSGLSASSSKIPSPPSLTSKVPFPSTLAPQVVASPVLVSKAPIPPPPPPQVPAPPEAVSHGNEKQIPMLPERSKNSEFKLEQKNVCPPWRRQKANYGGMEMTQNIPTEVLKMADSSRRTFPDASPLDETSENSSHIASADASSFNITNLLTPIIVPKQENEPPESQRLLPTPPISGGGVKDSEENMLYYSQNNYKSKAPSLLFNLKDIRKRVKSTYSPSPLLRTLEDKKIKEHDNIKTSFGAVNLLEESDQKMIENDEIGYKPVEQMDSTQEKESATSLNGHLTDDYRILSSPLPKEDTLSYLSGRRLWQESSMDIEDCEMVSVTDLHPSEHSTSQHSLSYKSFPIDAATEQEVYEDQFHLPDHKNQQIAANQNVDMETYGSPNLFFPVEENMINNENEACPASGKEHKDKKSPTSSEQSFVSITDQPFQEDQFFLMQLFQKACLQESQRSKEKKSEEENPSRKEREQASRQEILHDYGQSHYDSSMDGKCEEKEEQNDNENVLQERVLEMKREGRSRSMDSASEDKLEEPLTTTSSSSFKPNMFKIKDNTFKSAPVIKAVKLPLLRSMSCEAAISSSRVENEKQAYGLLRDTPNIQEMEWALMRNRHNQNAKVVATERDFDESGSIPADMVPTKSTECSFREELERFRTHGLVGDEEMANIPAIFHKDGKSHEKPLVRDKERSRAGKVRPSSACQLSLGFRGELAQNKQRSPLKEKINYFKNNLLAKGRGGSCTKKIIQATKSPIILDNQTCSPASSDAFGDLSAAMGTLTSSIIPSPRSVSTVQSAFTSPLSGAASTCDTAQAEKIADSSPHHRVAKSGDTPSVMEMSDPILEDADSFPVTNERLQLMGQMAKTAAKPPAVPPKTEKALRRAKKLASRRRKTETQQKKDQDESCSGDTTLLSLGPTPLSQVCLNSPLTPLESNLVRLQPSPPISPTHSLPATQRKLLQDPDSGEYFIVELPIQLKTFYDPESGRYIQVSVPPSKRNLSQMPSSEMLPLPHGLSPTAVPYRVSSVPVLASPSQFSESVSLMQGSLVETASDWQRDGQYPEPLGHQPYIDPVLPDVHTQETGRTQYNFEKDINLSPSADIISMGALEDFACEGIS